MNNTTQTEPGVRELTLGSIVKWIISIGLFLGAITSVFFSVSMGVAYLAAGLLIFPPSTNYIKRKYHISFSPALKVVIIIALFAIAVVASVKSDKPAPVVQNKTNTPTNIQTVFDMPSLVGKDLDALKADLGTPSWDKEPTALQIQSGTKTWEKNWDKEGYSVMATYEIGTRKVTELFLGASSDAAFALFNNPDNILKVGNLQRDDSKYSVEFVKAVNASGYTGAIVRGK